MLSAFDYTSMLTPKILCKAASYATLATLSLFGALSPLIRESPTILGTYVLLVGTEKEIF